MNLGDAAFDLKKVETRSAKSLGMHARFAESMRDLPRLKNPREFIAADALNLGAEFHASVALLCSGGQYASAHALTRPLIETTVRALWLMYVAPIDRIMRMTQGNDGTKFDPMVSQLLNLKGHPVLTSIASALGRQNSATLHSYTHAGFHLLRRRETGFSQADLLQQLMVSDMFGIVGFDAMRILYNKSEFKALVDSEMEAGFEELRGFAPRDNAVAGLLPMPKWKDLQ